MKFSIAAGSALIGIFALVQAHSESVPMDTVTHLPLPDAASKFRLRGSPMPLPNVPVCRSMATMNFYSAMDGKVGDAVAWYSANLKGFKHTHGVGSGRSQDTFYNAAGTIMVSVTGKPDSGQNAELYSIIYASVQPGASEKAIIAMNLQKVDCT